MTKLVEVRDRYVAAFAAPDGQGMRAVVSKEFEKLKDGFWFNENIYITAGAILYIERVSQETVWNSYKGKIREIT